MQIISNSEITSYNLCKRQWYYSYVLEIGPKMLPLAMYRGVIGHAALEPYYLLMKDGASIEECKAAAKDVLRKEAMRISTECPTEFERIGIVAELTRIIDAYAEFYRKEPFKVIAVESVYSTPIVPDELSFGMVLDLLVEMTAGEFRGDFIVIDTKFVYNFKSIDELELDAQLPKYIKTVRDNGILVSKGIFNQIRYRELNNPKPDQVFRRTPARINKAATDIIWAEQRDAAVEISSNPAPPRRTLSPFICKGCLYKKLCRADMLGQDTTNMIAAEFMPRKRPLKIIDSGE